MARRPKFRHDCDLCESESDQKLKITKVSSLRLRFLSCATSAVFEAVEDQ
jgi:hypothetical protein